MARRHGSRRGTVKGCQCHFKSTCYTTYAAAMSAAVRNPDATRAYRGTCCGHYHITRYTEDEYAQRIAALIEDMETEEVRNERQAQGHDEPAEAGCGPEGGEPRPSAGGAGAASLERGASVGSAPSPAALARIVAARRAS